MADDERGRGDGGREGAGGEQAGEEGGAEGGRRVRAGEEAAGGRRGGTGGAEGGVEGESVRLGGGWFGGDRRAENGFAFGLEGRRGAFAADAPGRRAGDLAAQRVRDALGVADLRRGARHGDEDLQDGGDEQPADFAGLRGGELLFFSEGEVALEAEVLAHESAVHDVGVAAVGGGGQSAEEGGAAGELALLVGAEEAAEGARCGGRGQVRDLGDQGQRIGERGVAVAAVEGGDALQAVDATGGGAVEGHGGGEIGVDEVFVEAPEVEVHGAESGIGEGTAFAVDARRGPVPRLLDVEGGEE